MTCTGVMAAINSATIQNDMGEVYGEEVYEGVYSVPWYVLCVRTFWSKRAYHGIKESLRKTDFKKTPVQDTD